MANSSTHARGPADHLNRSPFEHSESLDSHNIRLLNLHYGSGDEDIYVDIDSYSLENPPEYIALSYTWGSQADLVAIVCNGRKLNVTRNLYDALWQLREHRKRLIRRSFLKSQRGYHIHLWIDAICINQLDDEEKGVQVALMPNIYGKSSKVIAWLGPADKSSDLVMDYLNEFGEKAASCGLSRHHQPCLMIWQELAASHLRNQSSNDMIKTSFGSSERSITRRKGALFDLFYTVSGWHDQENLLPIAGMVKLFSRPWWGRIWVLQEVTLCADTDFICGTRRITRTQCSAAINAWLALHHTLVKALRSHPQQMSRYQIEVIRTSFYHRANIMLSSRRIYQAGKLPLLSLLRLTCVGTININRHGPHHLESTCPVDKIFALLGIAKDQQDLQGLGVYPDYTKPYEQIYVGVAAALLRQGHISLLSMCQAPRSSLLPSWAPDWSQSVTNMLQDVEDDQATLEPVFSAGGHEKPKVPVTLIKKDGWIQEIALDGCLYDRIYQVGKFPNRVSSSEVPYSETDSWPVEWLVEIMHLTYYKNKQQGAFIDRLRAVTRTSVGGVGQDSNGTFITVGDDRIADAAVLLQKGLSIVDNGRMKSDIQRFLNNEKTKSTIRESSGAPPRLDSEIIGQSLGRLPFITEKGHLVLSSVHVEKGDLIALIMGAQVPYILRPGSSGSFRLIGEAYVDSVMHGEAAKNADFGQIRIA